MRQLSRALAWLVVSLRSLLPDLEKRRWCAVEGESERKREGSEGPKKGKGTALCNWRVSVPHCVGDPPQATVGDIQLHTSWTVCAVQCSDHYGILFFG